MALTGARFKRGSQLLGPSDTCVQKEPSWNSTVRFLFVTFYVNDPQSSHSEIYEVASFIIHIPFQIQINRQVALKSLTTKHKWDVRHLVSFLVRHSQWNDRLLQYCIGLHRVAIFKIISYSNKTSNREVPTRNYRDDYALSMCFICLLNDKTVLKYMHFSNNHSF